MGYSRHNYSFDKRKSFNKNSLVLFIILKDSMSCPLFVSSVHKRRFPIIFMRRTIECKSYYFMTMNEFHGSACPCIIVSNFNLSIYFGVNHKPSGQYENYLKYRLKLAMICQKCRFLTIFDYFVTYFENFDEFLNHYLAIFGRFLINFYHFVTIHRLRFGKILSKCLKMTRKW